MKPAAPVRLLLGPQRPARNLVEAISGSGLPEGALATITAGWQEAENDLDELQQVLGRPCEDLCLYQRADQVFRADLQLAAAYRARQERLKELQRLYRLRLKQLAVAARQTFKFEADPDMVAAEQRHAIAQLRALDRHHLQRTESIHRPFDEAQNVATNALLARHASEIRDIIDRSGAVLITGGNIMVLLNRMRLFGVDRLLRGRHVVAWSAGAMVLAERVVLFHDRMPQGRRDPEIFGAGFGLVRGYVFLPDTKGRLRERDSLRIGLMGRRFAPDTCIGLDNGAALELRGDLVVRADAVRRINRDGRFARMRAA